MDPYGDDQEYFADATDSSYYDHDQSYYDTDADDTTAQATEEEPVVENLADLIYNEQITDYVVEEVKDDEEKATIEELASVLFYPEEIPRSSTREFAKNLYKSFRSCQNFMSILCRFPIKTHENDDHSIVFEYNWSSCRGHFFFITFSIITLLTILMTLNFISTMLNFPKHPTSLEVQWDVKVGARGKVSWDKGYAELFPEIVEEDMSFNKTQILLRAEEMFIFRRNMAPSLMVLFLMYHILVADWNLYSRRHFVASYLTFWAESVEIMKIDAAGEASKFVKLFLSYYLIWYIIFAIVLLLNFAPVASGAPVSFFFLWVRCFYPSIHTVGDIVITIFRAVGALMYMYIVICSKVYVFFFLYVCKILSTACTVWNERLEKVFTAEERSKERKEKCASRTGYDHLFKDYVTLLDLIGGADTLFTNIIESYYSTTIISIVFEVYYLVRPISGNQNEFAHARTLDMIPVGIYLFNTIMICYLVSTGAAEVGETAANGLEIIRRQGILGHRPDSEMHFMLSLYMSYTGHFDTALQGGGYFILDKSFFVAVAGTMISYIIIIFQFQPALGLQNEEHRNLIGVDNEDKTHLKTLVMHVENTFHYSFTKREPGF